jgi:predicted Rossmann fold nucleotide-binding protein DprA/Smf involved in DNA uptake
MVNHRLADGVVFDVSGNPLLLAHNSRLGVCGSRQLTNSTAERFSELISRCLQAAPHTVVSGGAFGTDELAHRCVLNSPKSSTILVLPIPLKEALPQDRYSYLTKLPWSKVLWMSQFREAEKDYKSMPIRRNQSIAAFSTVGIVGPCGIQSGTLSTVRFFRKFGVPFFYLAPLEYDHTDWQKSARYFERIGGKGINWKSDQELHLWVERLVETSLHESEKTVHIPHQIELFQSATEDTGA